jgi:hypothetical protein
MLETIKHPGMANGAQPYQQVVDINMIWQDMLGIPSQGRGSRFYFFLVFLACWGAFAGGKSANKSLAIALFLGGLGTLLFADVGSAITRISVIQPNRFGIQAYVLMTIPAALGINNLLLSVKQTGLHRMAAVASAGFAALGSLYFANELYREVTPGPHGHYGKTPPEVSGVGPLSLWTIDRLMAETDESARILFELSHARVHDGGHMAGYLAMRTHREFIGGAYPYTHFANAWDDWMFGHTLDDLTPERFREYLDLYNIGWLLLHSDKAKQYVSKLPDIHAVDTKGPLVLYRFNHPHSFFLEGNGSIESRNVNQLALSHLSGESIILKYHWVPSLHAEPPVEIDSVKMLDDPEPFIRIQHPPQLLRLFFRQ